MYGSRELSCVGPNPLLVVTNEYLDAEAEKLAGYVNNQVASLLFRELTAENNRRMLSLNDPERRGSFEVTGEAKGIPGLVLVFRRWNTLSYVNPNSPRKDFELQAFEGTAAGAVKNNPDVLLSPDKRPTSLANLRGFDDVNLSKGLYVGDAVLSYGQINESLKRPSDSLVWLHQVFLPATLQFKAVG